MTLVRRIARPLLAATFVHGGLDQLRHPAGKAGTASPVVHKLAPALNLPDDPELLVRINGAAMLGAGTMLATGRMPRLAALVLATSLVPTTYAGHRFWDAEDSEQRKTQLIHFLKNVSMVGGVLLAAVDTEGRPGVAWRGQRAAKDAKRAAGQATKDAKRTGRTARREAKLAARRAQDALPG